MPHPSHPSPASPASPASPGQTEPRPCPDCPGFDPRWAGVEVCRDCGLGRTRSATRVAEQQDYTERDPAAQRERRAYFTRLLRRHARGVRGRTALDVGCAGGQLLDVLERAGWQARGVDAHGSDPDDTRIVRQTLEDWVCTERFDLVTLVHSLEHFPDPRAVLDRVRGLTAAGGHVLIVVPHFGGLWARMTGADWHWLNPEDHCLHYTAPALRTIVERCGFECVGLSTDSRAAPSLVQVALAEGGFYGSTLGRRQPIRGIVFRVANRLSRPAGWLADRRGQGAELVMLARAR